MRTALLRLGLLAMALGAVALRSATPVTRETIARDGWSFDRSDLIIGEGVNMDARRAAHSLDGIGGWVDYDFEVAGQGGWYELWLRGFPTGWSLDIYLNGNPVSVYTPLQPEDRDPSRKDWLKGTNLHLEPGRHTLRLRRLMYSPILPSGWELRPSSPKEPTGNMRLLIPDTPEAAAHPSVQNAVRTSDSVSLKIQGGAPGVEHSYDIVAVAQDDSASGTTAIEPWQLARVDFPANAEPVVKNVSFKFPRQGVFLVLARDATTGKLLHPADLKAGVYVAVDTTNAPASDALSTRNVVDIDCTAEPPAGRFWEKDGPSRITSSSAGRYRESSGAGSVAEWGGDGFSYQFDLPEADRLYRIRVDYPDDDRRTMGFWIADGAGTQTSFTGVTNTGGVETGDHYALSGKMLTHEAYFYPRSTQNLIVAAISFVPGMKAAAARIRIDLVDSPLPIAPAGKRGSRTGGFYFEECGRWLRFFGGENRSETEQLKTLERYGQWQSFVGSNLMWPTVNVYGSNHYPGRELDGYMNTALNETRLAALIAEKYECEFVPEFFITGQMPFDSRMMGVLSGKQDSVTFLRPESAEIVLRSKEGRLKCAWKPFAYNPLHPFVQQRYLAIIGELANMLSDCKSFTGISSRLMIGWQFQAWTALPNLDWGYDDWTIAEFTRETGIVVPGGSGNLGKTDTPPPGQYDDPARYRARFQFLTSPAMLNRWMHWRADRIFALHQKMRDRLQQAKSGTTLFLAYFPRDTRVEYSTSLLDQMLEQGIDWKRYVNEPGIQIVPGMNYGRRFSTPLSDSIVTDSLYDPDLKALGATSNRAMGIFGRYFELNKNLDWTKLGARANLPAFDACTPAGRNELELFAIALADTDATTLLTGGNGWMFGTPDLMQRFWREYRSLPAAHFSILPGAVDPVTVRHYRDSTGTLWFYVVNRLPVPVTAMLSFSDDALQICSAADDAPVEATGTNLKFVLEPFMLRAFRASTNASIVACNVETPPDYVKKLRMGIEAAAHMADGIRARRIAPEASQADADAAITQLEGAISAFKRGEYWKARGWLQREAVTRFSYASGRYIPGMLERSSPLGVPKFSDAAPAGLQVVADPTAHGALTLFQPYKFENGDLRKTALVNPTALEVAPPAKSSSEPAAHRLLVQPLGRGPFWLDRATLRLDTPALGEALPEAHVLSRVADAAESSPTPSVGTRLKVHDQALYYISRKQLTRLDPEKGKAAAALNTRLAIEAFAFAPDGDLYLISQMQGSVRGNTLYRCRKMTDGWSTPEDLSNGKPLTIENGQKLTDFAIDDQGNALLILKNTEVPPLRVKGHPFALYRWEPDGHLHHVLDLGAPQAPDVDWGICHLSDGGWLIAAGNLRSIWRLDADNKVVWQTQREKAAAPGYVDLRCPLSIAADSQGNIWVTDPTRHQVLRLDLKTGRYEETLGSFGEGRDPTRLSLNQPSGVAVSKDSSGVEWLYIADSGNHRILRFPIR